MPQDMEKAKQILKKSQFQSKVGFEAKFTRRLQITDHEPGALVLIRNNPIENSVSIQQKTLDRYIRPYQVVQRTQGGSYVLEEMNGNILRHTTAAFRLIPYVKRQDLEGLAQDLDLGMKSGSDESSSNLTSTHSSSHSTRSAQTQSETETSTEQGNP